jgi:general stress protein 26
MPTTAEIEAKFWKSLKSDMTVMLGLAGADETLAQPMTAQLETAERGPIWFFTSTETDLAHALGERHDAIGYFASKGHDLFAAIDGVLRRDEDRATIDRLWNPFVAAWFEGGKTDPKLLLLRFDPRGAQIWLNDHSVFAAFKLLIGTDPKDAYEGKTAQVRLS